MVKPIGALVGITSCVAGAGIAWLLTTTKLEDIRLWPKSAAEQVYEACMKEMGTHSCAVMNSAPELPPDVKQIFIPGAGSVDAEVYRKLRYAGFAMCGQIKDACHENNDSEICRVGLALYPNK